MEAKEQNYFRNVYFVVDIATDVLRNAIQSTYKEKGFPTFTDFMNDQETKCCLSHLRKVKKCCLCSNDKCSGILTQLQWKTLYDTGENKCCCENLLSHEKDHCCNIKAKSVDLKGLDLRLCCIILTNVRSLQTSLGEQDLQRIEDLRCIRNKIFGGRIPPAEKSDIQFKDILRCIRDLGYICGNMDLHDYDGKGDNLDFMGKLTPDQVNFMKMTYSVVEVGGAILCTILELSATQKGFSSFQKMLDNREIQCEIFHLRKVKKCCICGKGNLNGPLSNYQWKVLYEIRSEDTCKPAVHWQYHNCKIKAKHDVMDNIDVNLAALLLINLHSWSLENLREVQDDLKCLRAKRNEILGSPVSFSLTEDVYSRNWNALNMALTKLAGVTGQDTIIQRVDELFRVNKFGFQKYLQSETYRVLFEFPPAPLSMYDYTRSKVIQIIEEIRLQRDDLGTAFDCDNYDLFVLHTDKIEVEKFCLEYFNAEATVEKLSKDFLESSSYIDPHVAIKLLCDDKSVIDSLEVKVLTACHSENKIFPIRDTAGRKYIYQNLYTVLRQKMRHFRKNEEKISEAIEKLENECYEIQKTGSWEVPESTASRIRSLMPHNVKCYSIRNGEVTIYINGEKEKEIYEEMSGDPDLKDMKWKLIPMSDRYKIVPFHRPGNVLYRTRGNFETGFGTLGLYAKLQNTGELVALTSGHVAFQDVECFVVTSNSKSMESLGICTWPPASPGVLNVRDLAVIKVCNSTVKQFCKLQSHTERRVRVFEGQRGDLDKRKIFKVGATTGKTYGYIIEPCMVIHFSPHDYSAILVEELSGKDFGRTGDSGAIVFLPEGRDLQAVSLLIGEHEIPGHPKACISSSMKEAIIHYEQNSNDSIVFEGDSGISEKRPDSLTHA